MSESQSPAPPPPEPAVSGRLVGVASVIFLLLISLFTYYVAPMFVTPYFREKPGQTEQLFVTLEAALRRYAADHAGALPPSAFLLDYRRANKNLARSHAPGMTTFRVASLTTPVAYIDPETVGDPYAVPEQRCPPAWALREFPDGTRIGVLSSAGPNLIYNLRPWQVRDAASPADLEAIVAAHRYDPSNGTRSGGDLIRLVVFPAGS